MTPSRSRRTAFMRSMLGSKGQSMFVILDAVIVGHAAVAGDYVEDDLAAFEVEAKFEFAQAGASHRFPQAHFVFFAVEHEKTTAARSGNFAADCAIPLGQVIPG